MECAPFRSTLCPGLLSTLLTVGYDYGMQNQILISVFGLCIAMVSPQVLAAIYMSVDENGKVVFSDKSPEPDTEEFELGPINTIPALRLPAKRSNRDNSPTAVDRYDRLTITRPRHDQSIRDNTGNITIALSVSPAINLGTKDQIVVTMDGREIARGTETRINLSSVSRGTHTLNAHIENPEGKQLVTADGIEFHMLRVSTLIP
jgi:hypothetical protein